MKKVLQIILALSLEIIGAAGTLVLLGISIIPHESCFHVNYFFHFLELYDYTSFFFLFFGMMWVGIIMLLLLLRNCVEEERERKEERTGS